MIENSVGLLKLSAACWCRISVNLELSAGSQSKIWRMKTYCRFLKLYCSLQVKYFWQFRTAFDSPESKILRDGNILQIFLILLPEIMSMFETYCSLQVLYFSQFGTVFALKARFWGMETYCRLPKSYCRNNGHGQNSLQVQYVSIQNCLCSQSKVLKELMRKFMEVFPRPRKLVYFFIFYFYFF